MRCEVKIPEGNNSYSKSLANFHKEWTEVLMQKKTNGCLPGELIEITESEGVVKFNVGVFVRVPIECIRVLD